MGAEAHADVWAALRDPAVVHSMCEDYRAGLTIDVQHDEADRAAGRRVDCSVQSLWATREDVDLFAGDPLDLLRGWGARSPRRRHRQRPPRGRRRAPADR
jgi:haloacetate dehalogenase